MERQATFQNFALPKFVDGGHHRISVRCLSSSLHWQATYWFENLASLLASSALRSPLPNRNSRTKAGGLGLVVSTPFEIERERR